MGEFKARIGLRGAAGSKRAPDRSFASKKDVEGELIVILNRSAIMSRRNHRAIDFTESTSVSGELVSEWEELVERCRVLIRSCSVLGLFDLKLTTQVCEAGADCALIAGNLEFYLMCQSRLLNSLYPQCEVKEVHGRVCEQTGNFLLYFGCFSYDPLEVSAKLRDLTVSQMTNKNVRFALDTLSTFAAGDYIGFTRMFGNAAWRQKTILAPVLEVMRRRTLRRVIKAYMSLGKQELTVWLNLTQLSDTQALLGEEQPDLKEVNRDLGSSSFYFRVRRQR